MPHRQLIVVGGGLAGLRAAVEARAAGLDVAVLSQVHPGRSHSSAAQGGINASLGNSPAGRDDSPERHAFDTVKGSDYLADQGAVLTMCESACEAIYQMDRWGALFSRFPDGRIAQRPFGGGAFPRSCYAADRTGHILLQTLYEQTVKHRIAVYSERVVTRLACDERPLPRTGRLRLAVGEAWRPTPPGAVFSLPPAATVASIAIPPMP